MLPLFFWHRLLARSRTNLKKSVSSVGSYARSIAQTLYDFSLGRFPDFDPAPPVWQGLAARTLARSLGRWVPAPAQKLLCAVSSHGSDHARVRFCRWYRFERRIVRGTQTRMIPSLLALSAMVVTSRHSDRTLERRYHLVTLNALAESPS
jgi:hypothetical protein